MLLVSSMKLHQEQSTFLQCGLHMQWDRSQLVTNNQKMMVHLQHILTRVTWAVSYAVSDEMSVSYGQHVYEGGVTANDQNLLVSLHLTQQVEQQSALRLTQLIISETQQLTTKFLRNRNFVRILI